MPPKGRKVDGGIPKSVVELRKLLEDAGLPCTKDGLGELAKTRKGCLKAGFSSMGTAMKKEDVDTSVKQEYIQLGSDDQRRGKLACYLLEPDKAFINATTSFHKEDVVETVALWLTEEQLSGPMWFNSISHSKIKCDAMRARTCHLPLDGVVRGGRPPEWSPPPPGGGEGRAGERAYGWAAVWAEGRAGK